MERRTSALIATRWCCCGIRVDHNVWIATRLQLQCDRWMLTRGYPTVGKVARGWAQRDHGLFGVVHGVSTARSLGCTDHRVVPARSVGGTALGLLPASPPSLASARLLAAACCLLSCSAFPAECPKGPVQCLLPKMGLITNTGVAGSNNHCRLVQTPSTSSLLLHVLPRRKRPYHA